MEQTPELTKALAELKRITGIALKTEADSPEELELVLTQVRCLALAYKEKYNKNHFLQNLMTDAIPPYDISERATRLHIEPDASRVLLLIKTRNPVDDTIIEVLKSLFPTQSRTYLVSMGEHNLVILRPIKASEGSDSIGHLAHTVVDTLNMEALTHVQAAYSGTISTLLDLPGAYREVSLALRIGMLFCPEQTVFPHNRLGIGRLIYQLPLSVCENFLKELFGGELPMSFDKETTAAINKFLQNNLNIAETSRQLHMHRNTLIYRLEQIERRTGLDIRRFEDAMTFKIATMVLNYLQTERNP